MKRLPSAVALVALFCAAAVPAAAVLVPEARKVLCYWNSWAFYRTGKGKSTPQRLDTAPCTHMVYNIVGIRGAEVVLSDPWNDLSDNGGNGNLRRFTNLKNKKSQLKVLAAVGGQSLGSAPFSRMARSETHRKSFAESGVSFCKRYRLNGLVLNWNYPGGGGGRPEDKENFVELLKGGINFLNQVDGLCYAMPSEEYAILFFMGEMKAAFEKANLSLGVDLSVAREIVAEGYNLPEISKNVHFMTVNAFDYWGTWSGRTGPVAPLHGLSDTEYTTPSVEHSVKSYLNAGVEPSKMVLAITTLARSWTLEDTQNTGYGTFTDEPGTAGPYTKTAGALGYNELCESLKTKKWTVSFDKGLQAPYAVNLTNWVSYEDAESAKEKAAFAKELKLGGIAIVTLDTDDFSGNCGAAFPILHSASREYLST